MNRRRLAPGDRVSRAQWLTRPAADVLRLSEGVAVGALELSAALTDGALQSTGIGMHAISALLRRISHPAAREYEAAAESLALTADKARGGLRQGVKHTRKGMRRAREAVRLFEEQIFRQLLDNYYTSSTIGSSLSGMVRISRIHLGLRMDGVPVSLRRAVADFRASGLRRAILYIPGLYCDDSIFNRKPLENGETLAGYFRARGYYPFFLQYDAGRHISQSGGELLAFLGELGAAIDATRLHILAYSQGALVLRAALYQDKERRLARRLGRVILLSSPDGGSWLEKSGYLLEKTLLFSAIPPLVLLAGIANFRSDGMKDLSHGIIREEDWRKSTHLLQYGARRYFGELDDIDAWQAYSVLENDPHAWQTVFGDGIIEHASEALLSATVYARKPGGRERVCVIRGANHFDVPYRPEFLEFMERILPG